jgi:hypothetical protein
MLYYWLPMRRSTVTLLLVFILAFGLVVRVAAFHWNWFMHADVIDDALVTASVHRDLRFLTYDNPPVADPALYPPLPDSGGRPLVLHGPLISLLGAGMTELLGGTSSVADTFFALRAISLVAGTLLIPLSFLIARRLLGNAAGLWTAALTAASYVLIDYAGNGALYTTQALIYLIWVYVAMHVAEARRAALLGLMAGIGYLTHLQCIILLPAGLLLIALEERPWRRTIAHGAVLLGIALPLIGLWLWRNEVVFGDPFYTHFANAQYVYGKAGLADRLPNVGLQDTLSVLHAIGTLWLPNNLYYVARKLFVITPLAFFFFTYGLIDVVFSQDRLRTMLPLLIIFTLHMLLAGSWPVWKFRFFIPILPFVYLFAVEELWHLPIAARWKYAGATVTLFATVIVGILTYRAIPMHTTYYDGALTQDPFHSSEEMSYLRTYKVLPPDDAQ